MTQTYSRATGLADGEWHRMHKATPLLRGGIAIVAVVGVIVANLRERIVSFVIGTPDYPSGDPVDVIIRHNFVWPAIGIAALVIALCVGVFALSWRVQTFRVTEQAVELRSGILRRQERKARLDRIQGVNIQRPVFARIFGAAKLEIVVAGNDANLNLAYLSSAVTETLRREILRLASGVRAEHEAPTGMPAEDGIATAIGQQAAPGGPAIGEPPAQPEAQRISTRGIAYVTRKSEGIVITRRRGADVAITIGAAEQARAAAELLVDQHRAGMRRAD